MLEFLNYLFSPRKHLMQKREARLQKHIPKMTTSYILSCADRADDLQEGAAKVLFVELSKRVKNSGIPLDDWI
jgi:hypothetical protein